MVNGKSLPLTKFVFPRTGSGTTYYIKAVIRHFERMGVPVINSSEAIDNVKDKLYTHQILAQSNLDIPKTMLLRYPIDIDFVEKNIGFPVIVKKIMNTLIHKPKPYPKDAYQFYPEVQTIEVESKERFYE